ncbi:putative oxidoreductase ephD [Favolaschia claudopus]|uniref:Oxidoreductase ephD n=1 Tax=Favolaschia claudopus TaxID=2862362 RepID=A0AAW0D1E8_9AGAR
MLPFFKSLPLAISWLAFLSLITAGSANKLSSEVAIKPTNANFNISAVSAGRFVTSKDGTRIFAEARGDCHKPAVIFIHGFRLGAMAFNEIFNDANWLSQVYLVRYDTRGHGRSDKPLDAAAWASERLAQDFDAVVQSYHLKRPFVLAWSLGGTHVADILSFHPANYLSGIIYDAAIPDMAHIRTISSAATASFILKSVQTSSILQLQEAYIDFINLCHPALEWNFYLACLGDAVIQPRLVTQFVINRTQSSTALLKAGRSGELPLLAIFGADDKAVLKQPVLDVIKGWKKLTVSTLPHAQHFTWVSQPVLFRETVLKWISVHSKQEFSQLAG